MIERVFLLAVGADAVEIGASLADSVDFIDEDDTRRFFLRLSEEIPYPGGADADKHFYKTRAGEKEKGHAGFASGGFGQQRFTGTGRAGEQYALGQLGADAVKGFRTFQVVDDFPQLHQGFLYAADIGVFNADHFALDFVGFALAQGHGRIGAAHASQQNIPEQQQGQQRQNPTEDCD